MTPARIATILKTQVGSADTDGNMMRFEHAGVPMMLVYDEAADRMRIIAAICELSAIEHGILEQAMEANFDRALDARYAVSNGLIWAAFIHPLSDLSESLLVSAVDQVATAARTFGGDFTSGALVFGS